jgi:hypothetical protein
MKIKAFVDFGEWEAIEFIIEKILFIQCAK